MLSLPSCLQSSIRLFNESSMFAATQYGAIMFTHDSQSTTNGTTYNSQVVSDCEAYLASDNPAGLTSTICQQYQGVGYTVNYNATALHGSVSVL